MSAKSSVITYDKKNLPWFGVVYDFYPTIPSPRLRDRKHTTRWIKIISNPKSWEMSYIYTYI